MCPQGRGHIVWLIVSLGAACGAAPAADRGAPTADAAPREALAIADALERRIDAGTATRADREAAHEAVRALVPSSAADALARAVVTGRLVQEAGLAKAHLVKDVERWAMKSRALDPTFRDEAATRLLGTLWVLAPASLLEHGDSEEGLALLEDLARRRPDVPQNHLRLGEAYLALGDAEPARDPLCRAAREARRLRRDERELLRSLLRDADLRDCPRAAPVGVDAVTADPAAPASPSTAPPAAP